MRLDSVISTVDAAELCAKGLAREGGYGEEQVDRLGMAVREAAANAVTHGNAYSAEKSVHFSVEMNDGRLVVKVRDEGEGFDPGEVADPTSVENLLKASGRGLLMMRALVDEVDVRNASPSGTEVVLVLHGPATEEEGQ
ncbi:MAG: ATP-binding protein [Acidobacteria bacterium]|nr:ATP-binding protein [Acidobacteriota bacterium]